VLALGFVAGIVLANYRPGPTRPPAKVSNNQAPGSNQQNTAGSSDQPQPDSSWRIVTPNPADAAATSPWPSSVDETPTVTVPKSVFTGPATDIVEARKALASDFSELKVGSATIAFEYQQMGQAGGTGKSVVGMIPASSYETWSTALRTEPDVLKKWLEDAARRVQSAAARDRFHIAWAVVDDLRDLPTGFADYEITPLENRTFLVIRPLASTVDYTKTDISLRPLASLDAAVANQPLTAPGPWATYGPVLRFDATDMYRPLGVRDTRPVKR
jgi:hypothetical protein